VSLTRRDRIRLLLESYGDVCDMGQRGGEENLHSSGKPGYRHLVRGGLWAQGSYSALERCLNRLQAEGYTSIRWHLVEMHVNGNKSGRARRRKADAGMNLLAKWMPANVYVPSELVERAGYPVSEANAAGRKRKAA